MDFETFKEERVNLNAGKLFEEYALPFCSVPESLLENKRADREKSRR
ncbi:hypothetical protein SAMN02910384_01524 [Pseudobutyrivibrio sp. ACV-2]|nr:hypothetical protein [Pseudobutyrivibrio sp. ACV-2]SEA43064.1 hypothetical protein SAMN02910384_01524 [Pseudobutyrivibrio sp. ACV-2]